MYYLISQTVGFFSLPTNIITFLALASLVLFKFQRVIALRIGIISSVLLVIAAFSPLGNLLLTPLEQRFPYMRYPNSPIDGIIVLGGSYDSQAGYINTLILHEDTEPMAVVGDLAKRYPEAQIIFSGGTSSIFHQAGPSEAEAAEKFFISIGISRSRILIEGRSRNTEENAQFTRKLLKLKSGSNWLLVTNAFHMPRAMGTFRKAGFNVHSFSVGWRTHGWRDLFWPIGSATENLRRVDIATREWLGMILYYWLGYSNETFPK